MKSSLVKGGIAFKYVVNNSSDHSFYRPRGKLIKKVFRKEYRAIKHFHLSKKLKRKGNKTLIYLKPWLQIELKTSCLLCATLCYGLDAPPED